MSQKTSSSSESPMPPQSAGRSGEMPSNDRRSLRRRLRLLPILLTLMVAVLGAASVWVLWQGYMERPWTRDGTVRSNVVTLAPDVGQVVELDVNDNQFVHKGDLLMKIDPRNYRGGGRLKQGGCRSSPGGLRKQEGAGGSTLRVKRSDTSREERQILRLERRHGGCEVEEKRPISRWLSTISLGRKYTRL